MHLLVERVFRFSFSKQFPKPTSGTNVTTQMPIANYFGDPFYPKNDTTLLLLDPAVKHLLTRIATSSKHININTAVYLL